MRILNLDAPFLVSAFRALGHNVLSIGASPSCDIVISHPVHAFHSYENVCAQGFVPDMVFCCDSGNLPYFPAIESLPCPSAFYSIDTYYNPWHFGMAYAFDHVFVAQREHVPLFTSQGTAAEWLPLFARSEKDFCELAPFSEPETHASTAALRDIPVAFVGTLNPKNIPDRKPFLEAFRKLHPLFITSGDYVPVFQRAHIVLNQTAASELNFRCFEAMACGAALLMEHSPHGLEELFTPGENILPLYTRGQAQEAAALARQALSRPQHLAGIAHRGQELVARHHTDIHRATRILEVLTPLISQGAHKLRLAELSQRQPHIRSACAMLFDELTAPQFQQHRAFFLELASGTAPLTSQTEEPICR